MPTTKFTLAAALLLFTPSILASTCNFNTAQDADDWADEFMAAQIEAQSDAYVEELGRANDMALWSKKMEWYNTVDTSFKRTVPVADQVRRSVATAVAAAANHPRRSNSNLNSKRQSSSSGSLECTSTEVCLCGDSLLFCLDTTDGAWRTGVGYSGNINTGDYVTPDGESGNSMKGPCPGELFYDASAGSEGACGQRDAQEAGLYEKAGMGGSVEAYTTTAANGAVETVVPGSASGAGSPSRSGLAVSQATGSSAAQQQGEGNGAAGLGGRGSGAVVYAAVLGVVAGVWAL